MQQECGMLGMGWPMEVNTTREVTFIFMLRYDFCFDSATQYFSTTAICGHSMEFMKHRNNMIWNNITETAQQISDRSASFLSSWKNAQEVRNQSNNRSSRVVIENWNKSSLGRFKCNVDASFSTSLNRVGFRACIRDAKGNFVIARTAWATPLLDVDMGEAMGLLAAMQWVKELNMVHMDFETDSKIVADSIYGKDSVSDFMAIINDCRHMLGTDLVNSNVSFIRRQANGAAHSLAKEALHNANSMFILTPHIVFLL